MRYRTVWGRLFNASAYSIRGLYSAVQQEQAFVYEVIVFLAICGVSISLPLTQGLILVGAWTVVMALELVNSAVERAFDLIDTNFQPAIRSGKDMLSAAVFLVICFNVVLWVATAAQFTGGGAANWVNLN